jgi:hypothetical protein
MRIFLAGIMQGSHRTAVLHDQHYRGRLKEKLQAALPQAEIYDPLADHPKSLEYGAEKGRDVFFFHNQLCREVDMVLAFVPEASMGTAIEMWEAHTHGRMVVTISPLAHNWAVRFLSDVVYHDEATFEAALASGELTAKIAEIRRQKNGEPAPAAPHLAAPRARVE